MKNFFSSIIEKIKQFWDTYKSSKTAWAVLVIILIIVIIVVRKGSTKVVDAVTVMKTDIIDSVVLSGRTQSASAVDLGFADQGRIATVNTKEGDKVREGQVLARLESSDLSANLNNAQAALAIARAGLSSDTSNLDNVTKEQDALVANAYRTLLSSGLEARSDNLDLDVDAPIISGSYNGSEGDYLIRVYPSGGATNQSFEVSGLESVITQQIAVNAPVPLGTRGLYITFGSGNYVGKTLRVSIPNKRSSVYLSNYNAYQAALTARDRAIANARAAVDGNLAEQSVAQARVAQARASVDAILAQIEKRTIRAPFDGVIANNLLKPGQSTTAGATADSAGSSKITLISENDYEVTLKAPEISVGKLSVGQAVDIRLDAYDKDTVFPGKIVSINPAETIVDGVPVYETKVVFTNISDRIRSGMTANATIVANRRDQVLAIPAAYIHLEKGESFVNVLTSDKKTEKRKVTTGLRGSDSMVEITEGLAEGDRVNANPLK